ncbi:DNA helicase UvrD [Sphingomonas sp. Leaf357]|uniref:double-strand break repair helicase AddA n=1 Tax=Sphingomonas sp. Leaf357 TaxID=1736350 RepID=UPI000700BE29|nr:double-strand break repair helicase AddA [Sphingomonas sp. Leaf357]KQS04500.1 DNA helicase UvrD [Sphingomonas sp. Leaf357]
MSGQHRSALPILKDNQARASAPDAHVWLSASAGTGKTQVLAARVFRLLLRGTDPGAILCLTFTKAGAAEMAARISGRLAAWVRMAEADLKKDLFALGENHLDPDLIAFARTLFAKVLDAPGGGIRIQTIHGFCQGVLAAFPIEAGLVPGFRPLEGREESLLARETLAAMLTDAPPSGIEQVGKLSLRLGEGEAENFLRACAKAPEGMRALPPEIGPFLRTSLGLPQGDIAVEMARCVSDDEFDTDAVAAIAAANRAWGTATGGNHADIAECWIEANAEMRVRMLGDLIGVPFTAQRVARKYSPKLIAAEPDYAELAEGVGMRCLELLAMAEQAAYADLLAEALTVGRDYASAYALAKRRVGAVDFDDLIRATVDLFDQPGMGEWIRYKLDQTTEHVLIDEAQDTNVAQWRIVRALADEFFTGRGSHAPGTRTLFTVGDRKQAIFGFQGTDPHNFEAAERYFSARALEALGDEDTDPDDRGLPMEQLALTQSFRSTRPVLEFVDAAIAAVGPAAMGAAEVELHASEVRGPGTVTLWPPVVTGGSEEDAEGWIPDATRALAGTIAKAVKGWLYGPTPLMLESKGRPLRPEDVMILVKRRGELASLIVARLYAEGVPVAGVDRLRLNAPLSVQDLLAAIRFVLQPGDDLSVASLLVSPLIGWTQDELMAAAPRGSVSLWQHLSRTQPRERLAPLLGMLARADIATPYRFFEELLSGALDGRRKLLRRLGQEARDPIEELLNAALDFETQTTPSLQRFLDWFDRGDVEIVRDPSAPLDAVRVMTAHGAKGLQAPLVILADATADPSRTPTRVLNWSPDGVQKPVPIFRPRGGERSGALGRLIELSATRELQEHWRLFYVAATRAEERLVIAGALGPMAGGVPPENSWYAAADRAFTAIGIPADAGERVFGGHERQSPVPLQRGSDEPHAAMDAVPDWARRQAPVEAKPPRPLAPSSLGEDAVADPPPSPAMRVAAERGRLIHALFERLPAVPADARADAADRWLAGAGGVDDAAARADIAATVLRVIDAHTDLFGPESLAEAPIAAVVGEGVVVSGTVDRLLVTAERVRLVDFKTGRHAPGSLGEVPVYHLRQMAAYVAALGVIFPDRPVEAALLYTSGPTLFALPQAVIDAHKPGFAGTEQSLISSA